MQETKDKVQWESAMRTMWESLSRVHICSKLLFNQPQRFRVRQIGSNNETFSLTADREFQDMRLHIASLQQQVDTLISNLNSLRQHSLDSDPGQDATYSGADKGSQAGGELYSLRSPHQQRKTIPRFHGPTSSAYGFDVANSTLQTMGITPASAMDEDGMQNDRTATASPLDFISPHPSKDPLWSISRQEAIRLCRLYEEEIGIMYPLFDFEAIVGHVNRLWSFLEAASRAGIGHMPGADAIDDDNTNLVKVILAAALIVEGNGKSDLGKKLFDSLKPAISAKFWGPTDTKGLSLICIAVGHLSRSFSWTKSSRYLADFSFRLCTTSTEATKGKPGALLALQLVPASRWDFIAENRCSDHSATKLSICLRQSCSGLFTPLIGGGALG
jgi:hypothetical protein